MAQKDLNFLPERVIAARERKKKGAIIFLAGIIYLSLLGWAGFYPFYLANEYQREISVVDEKLNELEAAVPYYEEMKKLEQELAEKEAAKKDIEKKQNKSVSIILEQVNSILPENCSVTYLDIDSGDIFTMRVMTNNPVETARVLVGLRKLELFQSVELSDVGEVPLEERARQVEFELNFKD